MDKIHKALIHLRLKSKTIAAMVSAMVLFSMNFTAYGVDAARVGQLVYNPTNKTVYLVGNQGLYGFPNAAVFYSWGYQFNQVVPENTAEQALSQIGIVPTKTAGCSAPLDQITGRCGNITTMPDPNASLPVARVGKLIFNPIGKTVYIVGPTGLYGFPSANVFYSWGFKFEQVVEANSTEQAMDQIGIVPAKLGTCTSPLDQIAGACGSTASTTTGSNTTSSNTSSGTYTAGPRIGRLVSSPVNKTVYLVGLNGLYGFTDANVFYSWGYKFSEVVSANSAELALNQVGFVPTKANNCATALDQINGTCGLSNTLNPVTSTGVPIPSDQIEALRMAFNPHVSTALTVNPTILDSYGTRVGNGTIGYYNQSCDQTKLARSGYASQTFPNSMVGIPSADVSCRTIGLYWLAALAYKDDAQNLCYTEDWTGKYQISCDLLTSIFGRTPLYLTGAERPQMSTQAANPNLNWNYMAGRCMYTSNKDADYGYLYLRPCGLVNPEDYYPPMSNPAGYNSATSTFGQLTPEQLSALKLGYYNVYASNANLDMSNPLIVDPYGTRVGPGIVDSWPLSCDRDRLTTSSTVNGYTQYHPQGDPAYSITDDIRCRTAGKVWVASLDYLGSDNLCYHWDWTGNYKIDCNILSAIAGSVPGPLPGGQVPYYNDTRFDWAGHNAHCYHTYGLNETGIYGWLSRMNTCGQAPN